MKTFALISLSLIALWHVSIGYYNYSKAVNLTLSCYVETLQMIHKVTVFLCGGLYAIIYDLLKVLIPIVKF